MAPKFVRVIKYSKVHGTTHRNTPFEGNFQSYNPL